jgi:hypothetical protein
MQQKKWGKKNNFKCFHQCVGFEDCWRAEVIGMATVDWKKKAIDKAKIATDLDHEASAMKDPKDREAQVGSHTVPEQALVWCTACV